MKPKLPRAGAATRVAVAQRAVERIPGLVLAAGIIWIVVGAPIVLFTLVPLLLIIFAGGAGGLGGGAALLVLFTLMIALIGGVFVSAGVRTVRGTAPDVLGNAIGSIVFGILLGGLSFDYRATAGIALLVAGILALVGRGDYLSWLTHRDRPRRAHPLAGRSPR